jgi:hypothetical protein
MTTTNDNSSEDEIYLKAEAELIKHSYFDLDTLIAVAVLLKNSSAEVRDDLRSKLVVRLIRRLYKSDIMLKKLEKNTQAYNYKLNQFIDKGLHYYIDLVKIDTVKPSLFSKLFCLRTGRFDALNEITKNLKRSTIDMSCNNNSTGSLSSPMEEAPNSEIQVDLQQQSSLSLPDNCQIVDPNRVSIVFEKGATPEKL